MSLTDVAAVLCNDGIVALGQAADKAVGVGSLGGSNHLVHGGVRLAVGNVLPHRAGTQPGVLQHHAVAAAQGGAGHIPDIGAGHLDAAAVYIIEPHKQVDEGGLAAAGGAYDGDALAGLHIQREPLDERAVGQVAEGHILQLHMAVRLQRGGVFGLRHLILGIQQFKHPGSAGQCIL